MLIGREKEFSKLNELYNKDSAEFVTVHGRRRVGKTFLIEEALAGKFSFRHTALSPLEYVIGVPDKQASKLKRQLDYFYDSLISQGMDECEHPESWMRAFHMLETFLEKKEKDTERLLVLLDEIQWMDTPKSGFMTALEAFWNGWACHKHNIMLIACGSSGSWILDKLIYSRGGLYGRITYQINLQPFSLHECELFFDANGIEMSRYDITQAYMTAGGIPYYLNCFEKGLSLDQNIQAMFFDTGAPLSSEFDLLFTSQFVNAAVMKSIVKALNTKNRGLTRKELLSEIGITDSGEVSRYLNALITSGFIIKYYSFGNGKREGFYKLIDPFCIFYLKFVEKNTGRKNLNWTAISDTQAVISWRGIAFENVCFNHIRQIKFALGISGVSTSESLWSKKGTDDTEGAQTDLIIERKDNVINMCEIKFCSDEFTVNKDTHLTLERRKRLIHEKVLKKATVHNTLITTFGLRKTEHFSDIVNMVTLEDLFRV